ncbi:MAG: methyltransferase domain-containing protein [Syntrophales bacterium]|nr:methyltransferase domain-containing protein [Syntrophales bacterium]
MLDFKGKYLKDRNEEPLLILDLGSLDVNGSYREYFDVSPWTYHGVDMTRGKNVDIVLNDPYDWETVRSNSVDVLISGQAFEHIEFFWITMLEIERVLRPGGLCCIIAPSGGSEHRFPVDCWRFYPDGFAALGRFAGLEVVEACTQWKPDSRYTDLCNSWRDSVLICRKEALPFFSAWRRRILHGTLHKISVMQLKGA